MAKPKTRIGELRVINFLTQKDVATYLGMTHMNYSKIERGQRGLSLENAKKLKILFKVSHIEDLFDESEAS